jgi:membrane associated rhomboid family serine protease
VVTGAGVQKTVASEDDQSRTEGGHAVQQTSAAGPNVTPVKREPIFNQMPVGVAIAFMLILFAHIAVLALQPDLQDELLATYGLTPALLAQDFASGDAFAAAQMLIGHQFIHGGTIHLVMNLAMLLQAGPIAEAGLRGHRDAATRFVFFFVFCGIGGGLTFALFNPGSWSQTIGASGAISGVFAGFLWGAIGLARPGQAMLKPVIASAFVFLLINVGLAALARGLDFVPIAWESHLGGFITGLILYPIFARLGRKHADIGAG